MEEPCKQDGSSPSKNLIKSTFKFASGTFLSRIGGLFRDMSMAFCFGTDPAIAAFLVAFRFSNLLRRIFGEGALLNSFIPHFETHRSHNPKLAAQFFRDIVASLIFLLIFIIAIIEAALLLWLIYGNGSEGNQDIVFLTMIMFPGLLFICLFSICSALLQCEQNFFLTGIAPLLLNIIWICSIWLYKDYQSQQAVIYLSISITFAYLLQWLLTLPKSVGYLLKHLTLKEVFKSSFFTAEIRGVISSVSLGIIGVSASQINSAIDALFARYASLEGPAYLNYAIHLQQLPLALFGIGMSMALLPALSKAIQDSNLYKNLLHFALSNALLLLIPCSMALLVLGCAGINLIYGRGDFNQESVKQTTLCLWGYGIGLVPMGITVLLASAFYAKKDFKTPTLATLVSLAINIILNILFVLVFEFGPASLAFSTSLAACGNAAFLFNNLVKKADIKLLFSLVSSSFKIIGASLLSGVITLLIEYLITNHSSIFILIRQGETHFTRSVIDQIIHFTTLLGSFVSAFLLLAWILRYKRDLAFS